MKLVVFGLTISSSWGNGHATLWRGLCKGLARLGHRVVFFERDVPYYASSRDWHELPCGELVLYESWEQIAVRADDELADADAAIVTSYCPDALAASDAVMEAARPVSVFYDLDTPITLARLRAGERVSYVPERGLRDFDLVLSYTGGAALDELERSLGARNARPLYGHVDPDVHHPVPSCERCCERYRADLSYLGTYAADRQAALERLFVAPARCRPQLKFLIGGAQYPPDFPWTANVYFVQHVPPSEHAPFFSSSRLTLNVTRAAMAEMGWCPSGRLFEASACGAALLSDAWAGLEDFYQPGAEILLAEDTTDALSALDIADEQLERIRRAARERTLDEHTCHHRARMLTNLLESSERSRYSQRTSLFAASAATRSGTRN
jgi:spore maturation protein CgeB